MRGGRSEAPGGTLTPIPEPTTEEPARPRPHLGTGRSLLWLLVFADADKPGETEGDPLLTIHLVGGEGEGGEVMMETLLGSSPQATYASSFLASLLCAPSPPASVSSST